MTSTLQRHIWSAAKPTGRDLGIGSVCDYSVVEQATFNPTAGKAGPEV